MANKYSFAITREHKLLMLAEQILDKYEKNGTPITLENFAEYCELLRNTCGENTTNTIYRVLVSEC